MNNTTKKKKMKYSATVTKLELVKVETKYNPRKETYFYNIYLDNVEGPLLLDGLDEPIKNLAPTKLEYNVSDEGIVSDFIIH